MVRKSNSQARQDRATLFRDRLALAMERRGLTRAALARETGVDRSTLSQILSDDGGRLANAHLVAGAAEALQVSSDWLLGLSDRPEMAGELLDASLALTDAPRGANDARMIAWHREAEGMKIRHVPATLPDLMKTRAMADWEYGAADLAGAEDGAGDGDPFDRLRASRSDYEIALPIHELASFAAREGYSPTLPQPVWEGQIEAFERLHAELYPRVRLYLYDARQVFSAPLTVLGPLMAALYIGQSYILFRDRARVEAMAAHVDALVRAATVPARDFPLALRTLARGELPRADSR